MSTIAELESALVKAHQAGRADHAQIFADEIRKQQSLVQGYSAGGQKDDTMTQFLGGAKHAWDKAAYGLEGAVKGLMGQDIDKEHQTQLDQGKAYVANTGKASSIGEFAGEAVPYAATAIASGGASLLPRAIAQGVTGMTVTPGDIKDRAIGAGSAVVGEGLGTLLPHAISRIAKPINPTEQAKRLIDQGIYPTAGSAAGGFAKSFEDKMMSMPLVGDAIAYGRKGAIKEGNAAAISRGGVNVPAGHEGFAAMDASFNQRFPDAVKNLAFDINDPAFQQTVKDSMRKNNLNATGIDDINGFFKNFKDDLGFTSAAPATNATPIGNQPLNQLLGGQDFHAMLRQLRDTGGQLRKGSDPYAQRTGQAYKDIFNAADDALSTQGLSSVDDIAKFRQVREDWAKYTPAKNAGESVVTARNDGIFSPLAYSNAVVNNAKKMGGTAQVRHGDAMNQKFATDMVQVLGNNYPDSGSAGRLLLDGGILSGNFFAPHVFGPLTAAGGISAAMNTKAGRKYMVGAMSPKQEAISAALRKLEPLVGGIGATYNGARNNQDKED